VFSPCCWATNSLLLGHEFPAAGPGIPCCWARFPCCFSAGGQAGQQGNRGPIGPSREFRAQRGVCCLLGPAGNSGPSRGKTQILLNRSLTCTHVLQPSASRLAAHTSHAGLRFGHVDHVDQAVHMDIWGGLENGPHMVHMVHIPLFEPRG
jgi:hypothetical protein